MPLTDKTIKAAKPGITPDGRTTDKPYKLADAGGLYLEVSPNGSRYWRLKYRHAGKEKRLALGVYPAVTLTEARKKREAAKKAIGAGEDPAATMSKREKTRAARLKTENSFEAVAREWDPKIWRVFLANALLASWPAESWRDRIRPARHRFEQRRAVAVRAGRAW